MKKKEPRIVLSGKNGDKFELSFGQLTYDDREGLAVKDTFLSESWDWDSVTHNRPGNCRKLAEFLLKAAADMEK